MLAPLLAVWRLELEAGGIGFAADSCPSTSRPAGEPLDRGAVDWWEVMATVRWAMIARCSRRHRSEVDRSLELALTAHVLPGLELDLLTRVSELESAA